MNGFSFKPKPDELEEFKKLVDGTRVWWVEFSRPVERIFCDGRQCPTVVEADYGITWMGVSTPHWPRKVPTNKPDVWCFEFGVPVDLMAVAHERMAEWMKVVRANSLHGQYREAGTDRWYEF